MKRGQIFLASTAMLYAATASLSHAAESDVSAGTKHALEEVVVTAQKREEKLQDIPFSISAMTEKDLEVKGITSIRNALEFTPSITTTSSYGDSNANNMYMRGIGNICG